jgi:hypothetical protein
MARKGRDTEEEQEGRLARWSKRKLAAKAPPAEEPAASPEPAADRPEGAEAEEDPVLKANRQEAEAIDIDVLTYESDFSPFLKAGVPGFLRRRALRKLWTSHPLLANRDGLNDYDLDFETPETAAFKSAWEVGKGYLEKLTELGGRAEASESESTAQDSAAVGQDEDAADEGLQQIEEPDDHVEQGGQTAEGPAAEPESAKPRVSLRRRLMG